MRRAFVCFFMLAIIVCTAGGPIAAAIDPEIKVSLAFDDTPIAAILKMLAEQNHLNLVVPTAVDEKVSLKLNEVSLRAALDAVLLPNGYSYYFVDDIIIVKTSDQKAAGELGAVTYQMKYIDAAIAQEAIKPLLSAHGQVVVLAMTTGAAGTSGAAGSPTGSRLVVVDMPSVQRLVADLVDKIDQRRRQVSVEVKFIETNLNENEKLGINWPKSVALSVNGVATPGTSTTEGESSTTNAAVLPLDGGHWQLGYLSVAQLNVVLDFLSHRNNAKLLSNPRLTTIDGEMAIIQTETVIPIQTINRFSEGAIIQDIVTFQDERVGISLQVTPRINDDSTITLKVNPVVAEIIGYSGPPDNQKPITSERTITTNVTVGNNETLAMGGLLKESRIENRDRIFLLGSLPVLGGLFTHRTTEVTTTDLLILITPRIVD